jgi:DNA-binding NtrC family response regulator
MVAKFFSEFGDAGAVTRLDAASQERLLRYDWPGNVRELRNVIEVAFELSQGGPIEIPELGSRRSRAMDGETHVQPSLARPYKDQRQEHVDGFDLRYFTALLRETKGNLSEVARMAGLDPKTVRERLERVGLRKREPE